MKFIGFDANGTDGSDDSKMLRIYDLGGRLVRVPVNITDNNEVRQIILEDLGFDEQEIDSLRTALQTLNAFDPAEVNAGTAVATLTAVVNLVKAHTQIIRKLVL